MIFLPANSIHRDWESTRFEGLLLLHIPYWVISSFLDVSSVERGIAEVEEEQVSVQNRSSWSQSSRSHIEIFGYKKTSECYPLLWNRIKIYVVAFATLCLVEQDFDAVASLFPTKETDEQLLIGKSPMSSQWVPVLCWQADISAPSTTIPLTMTVKTMTYVTMFASDVRLLIHICEG